MKRAASLPANRVNRSVVLLVSLAVPGWALGAGPAHHCDPGREAVREVMAVAEGIIAADNERDIRRVLGYYAADAVLLPPGEQPVQGREAIRPRYEDLFARFNPEIVARVEEVCVGGDLALVRGHNGGRLISRENGSARLLNDVYMMMLRRDLVGGWHITHLMWHPAEPVSPAAAE